MLPWVGDVSEPVNSSVDIELTTQVLEVLSELTVASYKKLIGDSLTRQLTASLEDYVRILEWVEKGNSRHHQLFRTDRKLTSQALPRFGVGNKAPVIYSQISDVNFSVFNAACHQLSLNKIGNCYHSRKWSGHHASAQPQKKLLPGSRGESSAVHGFINDRLHSMKVSHPGNRAEVIEVADMNGCNRVFSNDCSEFFIVMCNASSIIDYQAFNTFLLEGCCQFRGKFFCKDKHRAHTPGR